MDPTTGTSAADRLQPASGTGLHEVIKEYGEERFGRLIARAIVAVMGGKSHRYKPASWRSLWRKRPYSRARTKTYNAHLLSGSHLQ